jgi:hypothetical protein
MIHDIFLRWDGSVLREYTTPSYTRFGQEMMESKETKRRNFVTYWNINIICMWLSAWVWNDNDNDNEKPIKSLLKGKGLLLLVGLARLDS